MFTGLEIWQYEEYRKLQGTWPVIGLSFANVKSTTYERAIQDIRSLIAKIYGQYDYILNSDALKDHEKEYFLSVCKENKEVVLEHTLNNLSDYNYTNDGNICYNICPNGTYNFVDELNNNTNAYINAIKKPYISILGHIDDGRIPCDFETIVKTLLSN